MQHTYHYNLLIQPDGSKVSGCYDWHLRQKSSMGDVATADPGTCGTAEDAGALEQMWHLDLHHFCEERGAENLLKPVPSHHADIQKTWDFARWSPGLVYETLCDQFRPSPESCQPSKESKEFIGGVHVGVFSQKMWIIATRPGECPVKVTPAIPHPEEIQAYSIIQYHCTPSIVRVSNAARVLQDWIGESSGHTINRTKHGANT